MGYIYETPEEAAHGQKMDIMDFFAEWAEAHDIYDDTQRRAIWKAVRQMGWSFFHQELLDYFEQADGYEVGYGEEIEVEEY